MIRACVCCSTYPGSLSQLYQRLIICQRKFMKSQLYLRVCIFCSNQSLKVRGLFACKNFPREVAISIISSASFLFPPWIRLLLEHVVTLLDVINPQLFGCHKLSFPPCAFGVSVYKMLHISNHIVQSIHFCFFLFQPTGRSALKEGRGFLHFYL